MKTTVLISWLLLSGIGQIKTQPPVSDADFNILFNRKTTNMANKDFSSTILVDKDAETAFRAIKDFRGWWSEEIEGKTDQLNETFFYHYKDIHLCKLKLIEVDEPSKLVYLVTENEFNFVEDKTEWVGSHLVFDIKPEGDKTRIQFTHEGLTSADECYEVCRDAWTTYIQKSLYQLITTGKGTPNPKDSEGINAELAKKWKLDSKEN